MHQTTTKTVVAHTVRWATWCALQHEVFNFVMCKPSSVVGPDDLVVRNHHSFHLIIVLCHDVEVSLSLMVSGIFPFKFLFIHLIDGPVSLTVDSSAARFFESLCSSIVVVVVYDQQLQQSSSTLPLLEIFFVQILLRHI
jgi:hypothetical protein